MLTIKHFILKGGNQPVINSFAVRNNQEFRVDSKIRFMVNTSITRLCWNKSLLQKLRELVWYETALKYLDCESHYVWGKRYVPMW